MNLLAGTCLMSLVFVGVAPSTSQAGCGHYALSKADRAALEALTGPMSLDLTNGRQPGSERTDPRRGPCSGPSCSNGPGVPLTPIPKASVRADQWCCTSAGSPLLELERIGHLAESAPLRPLHCGLAIERPPRIPTSRST
jgi:hypothetical protein